MTQLLPSIEVSGLTKDFKTDFWKPKVRALEEVSFAVPTGAVFGLIGPNGAGKTTVIKTLLGLIRPTKGAVRIQGKKVTESSFKRDIGYLPENAYYYDYLKGPEILDFYGRLFGMTRKERGQKTDELLELVGLNDKREIRLRSYSKGMLQRIGIAQSMVNDPKIVILDEPMSGLDPIGRKEVRDIILRLAERGKTILFSSHILSDVEAICEDVAILVRGKLKAYGAIRDLVKTSVQSSEIVFEGEDYPEPPKEFESVLELRKSGGHLVVRVNKPEKIYEIVQWGKASNLKLISVVPQKETLEALFLEKAEQK